VLRLGTDEPPDFSLYLISIRLCARSAGGVSSFIGFVIASGSEHDCWMFAIAFLFVHVLCDCYKSRRRLKAEILVPGISSTSQQRAARQLYLTWANCVLFVWLCRHVKRAEAGAHWEPLSFGIDCSCRPLLKVERTTSTN
jgi:hypothetical protein